MTADLLVHKRDSYIVSLIFSSLLKRARTTDFELRVSLENLKKKVRNEKGDGESVFI